MMVNITNIMSGRAFLCLLVIGTVYEFATNVDSAPTATCCYCPNGWIRFDDSCYFFEDLKTQSWHQAMNSCQVLGGDLLKVETSVENNFIKAELAKLHPASHDGFWIAGHDIQIEGDWVWAHTNERIETLYWYPGEPNNSGNEDCIEYLTGYHFLWNDKSCDIQKGYVCEKDDSLDVGQIIG